MDKFELIQEAVRREMGTLTPDGAFVVETGAFTGRAADKRFLVEHPELKDTIDWGSTNKAISPVLATEIFAKLEQKLGQTKTFSMNGFVSAFPLTVVSTSPWHIAFAHNMFRSKPVEHFTQTVKAPGKMQIFHDPYGKVSDLGVTWPDQTIIVVDPLYKKVAIIGTAYAGEIKKSAFTLCNYMFPEFGFFPMHSSANCRKDGSQSSILFGLSGTGKTTLSADPARSLIGDDEIVWSPTGISNLEAGCYAKLIKLSKENEPEIYRACFKRGTILENIGYDRKTETIDFNDDRKTENTRGSYSIDALGENVFDQNREAGQPKTIIFLTADAFGAMPAVARLDSFQAQYHFISGYTAKLAGTEIGVKEPTAAFSNCFGAPFMPRPAAVYAKMLAEFSERAGASVWLLNTGWTGGPYGVGKRFPIPVTRALLNAIQDGSLNQVRMQKHPVFGFEVPTSCPGVDAKFLELPRGEQVSELAKKFTKNMEKFAKHLDKNVIVLGGPQLGSSAAIHGNFAVPSA